MNTLRKSFLILFSITGLVISAQAQRGSESRGQRSNGSYSDRNGGSYSSRNGGGFNRQSSSERSSDFGRQSNNNFERRTANDGISSQNPVRQDNSAFRRSDISSSNDRNLNRDVILGNQRTSDPIRQDNSSFRRNDNISSLNNDRNQRLSDDRSLSRNLVLGNQRGSFSGNRTVIVNNNYGYNRYPTVYSYGPAGYSFVRYNYYSPRRYVYVGAPRYNIMPRTFISISFGGYPYWYDGGIFYGYYGGYYEPVFAPRGIHVSILPAGYYPIHVGPDPYYYYEGIYYRRLQDRNDAYEVVDAPMGAVVKSLPKGATKVVLNGEKFYEFDGTYYTEGTNNKNELVYTVVGKNGVINNSGGQPEVTRPQAPQIGDEITTLPENSKQVTINGDVLYVTPDHLYLKSQNINDATTYKVVGKAE